MANRYTDSDIPSNPKIRQPIAIETICIVVVATCWLALISLFGLATNFGLSGQSEQMRLCERLFIPFMGILGVANLVGFVAALRNNATVNAMASSLSLIIFAIVSYNMFVIWLKIQT